MLHIQLRRSRQDQSLKIRLPGTLVCVFLALCVGGAVHASSEEGMTVKHAFFEPFIWGENGGSRGIYVDVLKEALEVRLGIPVTFEDLPWKRAQKMVEKGQADGMVTVITPERLEYTEAVEPPVAITSLGVFTYAGHPRLPEMQQIRKLDDLHGYKILTYLGDGWAQKNLAGFDVDYGGKDLRKVLLKLEHQRGDLVVHSVEVTLYNLKKLGHEGGVVQVPKVSLNPVRLNLLIGKKSPYLSRISDIGKTLTEMRDDGTLEAIFQKYR